MGKREETDEKAMYVYSLVRQNMSKTEIALFLGMHRTQVHRLINRAKNVLRWIADNIDGKMHLGETLIALQDQERRATEMAAACEPGSAVAVGWEKIRLECRKEIKKLLQECGAVFKMPEAVEDGGSLEDPESRKEYLEWRARSRARAKARGKEGEEK